MTGNLKSVRTVLEKIVGELDPNVIESTAALGLVTEFAAIEHLAAAGKALVATRVASSGAWKASGDRSAAHWMASATGTAVGTAAGLLETAARLEELPATDRAVRSGKLSEAQTKEIASAATASPASEAELLEVAATAGMATLKERCAQVRAAAVTDESEHYARIYRRRRLRHFTDSEGAFRVDALLTPDAGARLLAALEPYKERIFADARRQQRTESPEAYYADALIEMAEDAGHRDEGRAASPPGALVHVFVDHGALVRGHTATGEVCEIAGVGPIPVATARALATDAYLRVLVTDGTDVTAVAHARRTLPARLKTAVTARDRKCQVPGCEVRRPLHIDHVVAVSDGGLTSLANLQRLCPHHHYLKTHKGYRTGGRPGARTWHPPADPASRPDAVARAP